MYAVRQHIEQEFEDQADRLREVFTRELFWIDHFPQQSPSQVPLRITAANIECLL
jgi:hypothetical protein